MIGDVSSSLHLEKFYSFLFKRFAIKEKVGYVAVSSESVDRIMLDEKKKIENLAFLSQFGKCSLKLKGFLIALKTEIEYIERVFHYYTVNRI